MAEQNKLSPEKLKAMEKNAEEFCRVKMEEPKEERGTEEYGRAIANWYKNYITPLIEECKKPEYGGLSWAEITTAGFEENGGVKKGSLLEKALDAVYPKGIKNNTVKSNAVEKFFYPVDKVNDVVWKAPAITETENGTRITARDIAIDVQRNAATMKDCKPVVVNFSIDFDKLKDDFPIYRLTEYDKRLYLAAGALFNAGNEYATLSMLYNTMAGIPNKSRNTSKTEKEKLLDCLKKMQRTEITVDNTKEVERYSRRGKFYYYGSLLPFEAQVGTVKGGETDAVIHLLREPPLISFAKQRGQFTTINPALLATPISITEDNLSLEDYLINYISWQKNEGKEVFNILFNTLFEKTNTQTAKQKQRLLKDKLPQILNYYKEQDFITGYKINEEKKQITIQCANK